MSSSQTLISALQTVLQQGVTLLEALDDFTYAEKVPVAYNSSIGGHYRHCLDHFKNLFDSVGQAELDYDQRQRDPRLEKERLFALEASRLFVQMAEALTPESLAQSIRVRAQVGYEKDSAPWVDSTLNREVMYCVAHAVHHYALIGVLCGLQSIRLPNGFGVAASTLKYQQTIPAQQRMAA